MNSNCCILSGNYIVQTFFYKIAQINVIILQTKQRIYLNLSKNEISTLLNKIMLKLVNFHEIFKILFIIYLTDKQITKISLNTRF